MVWGPPRHSPDHLKRDDFASVPCKPCTIVSEIQPNPEIDLQRLGNLRCQL
jgi:hypothetical protein